MENISLPENSIPNKNKKIKGIISFFIVLLVLFILFFLFFKESSCIQNWQCTNWSNCINNTQIRVCSDSNNCKNLTDKPEELKNCSIYDSLLSCSEKNGVVCMFNQPCNSTKVNSSDSERCCIGSCLAGLDLNKNSEERMKEKISENYYQTFGNDSQFPNKKFDFYGCNGTQIFIGEKAISPMVTWNNAIISFNFIKCPPNYYFYKTREADLEMKGQEIEAEKDFFEGREIKVEKIINEEVTTSSGEKYPAEYEYRFYNCEGIILEGVYLNYGTGRWDQARYNLKKLFNDMISACLN